MLQTWESIIQKYNSIGHTSRATKNLEDWGELLASAYIVNAEKADKLWQELIELNVATDEKFAKYFVAQSFNAIISRLDAEDAVAEAESVMSEWIAAGGSEEDEDYNLLAYYAGASWPEAIAAFKENPNDESARGHIQIIPQDMAELRVKLEEKLNS